MLNLAVLQGRLTDSPELKSTVSGTPCTRFRVAIERRIASADGHRETDFIEMLAWKSTAEFVCRHFQKGDMILIRGSIQTRSCEVKDGSKRTAVEIVVDEVSFCGTNSR